MFGLTVASKYRSPRIMNFGLLLMTEFVRFTRLLGSKSVTISPGRIFTPIFQCKIRFEFISWDAYLSIEVFNGSMFLDHFEKLDLLPQLGLKTFT